MRTNTVGSSSVFRYGDHFTVGPHVLYVRSGADRSDFLRLDIVDVDISIFRERSRSMKQEDKEMIERSIRTFREQIREGQTETEFVIKIGLLIVLAWCIHRLMT